MFVSVSRIVEPWAHGVLQDCRLGCFGDLAGRVGVKESHVIEVGGQFAGAAISHQGRFRFIAVDARVEELDESGWPSVSDARLAVGHLMRTGHLPPTRAIERA